MIDADELAQLVVGNIRKAVEVADAIQLEARSKSASAGMLADAPAYRELPLGWAKRAWAATLFVDLRGSTNRAIRIGARDTFITMQAYIPAMAQIIGENDGYIVGFRGDGIFAAFGLDDDDPANREDALKEAATCGKCMLDAVHKVINPALVVHDVEGELKIGVGIDVGEIVVTRIGLPGAFDITAYGDSVNTAAHLADEASGRMLITPRADEMYPRSPGGRVTTDTANTETPAVVLQFPEPYLPAPNWKPIFSQLLAD